MRRLTFAVVAVAGLAAPVAVGAEKMPLPAQYVEKLRAPAPEAMKSAAGFLAAAQRELKSPDGKASLQATWPFEEKGTTAAPNAAGIVARALAGVHGKVGIAQGKAAAEAWGRARLVEVAAGKLLFDPDVEALAEIARLTGDASYAQAAKAAFDLRHSGATGREIVERLFMVRKGNESLVGFDAAHTIRAALAVGQAEKAREVAQALADTEKRWNAVEPRGFYLTSRGAVLEALELGRFDLPLRASLRPQVLASQGKDGAWGQRNTQATAYSVRALLASGDGKAAEAAAKGTHFLRATQLQSGAWATFNDFLPEPFVGETIYEVTAEVLLALAR